MLAQMDSTSERNQFPLQEGEEEEKSQCIERQQKQGRNKKVVQFGSCDMLLLRLHKVTHSVNFYLPVRQLASCPKDMGLESSQMKLCK